MSALKFEVLDLRFSKHHQGWDFTRVTRVIKPFQGRVPTRQIIRTNLHIDSSYPDLQSHGRVELWTAAGWVEVSTHPGAELHDSFTITSSYKPNGAEAAQEELDAAATVLESVAIGILFG